MAMASDPIGRPIRGRGANINPSNRFEALHYEPEDWCEPDTETRPLRTQFLVDDSQSIISYNNSPDIGFDASLNPYRGCEHGCAYCYARPTHEYLGFSAGIDFESRILVKPKAAELLAAEFISLLGNRKISRSAASRMPTSRSNESYKSRGLVYGCWLNFGIPSVW